MCSFNNVSSQNGIINVLPREIFPLVFSHLSIKDLGRAAQVSKMFNEIQNKSELWENILKNIPKKPEHSVANDFYIKFKEKVQNVVINISNKFNINDIKKIFFNGNLRPTIMISDIYSIYMGINTEDRLKDVIPYFPNFHRNYYIECLQIVDAILYNYYFYYDNNNQFQFERTHSDHLSAIVKDLVKNRKKIMLTGGF